MLHSRDRLHNGRVERRYLPGRVGSSVSLFFHYVLLAWRSLFVSFEHDWNLKDLERSSLVHVIHLYED